MKRLHVVVLFIFAGAFFLRTGLALYNRQANDPHMPVIKYILRYEALPDKNDCWECYQPKLFHYFGAKFLELLQLNHNQDGDAQIVVIQLVNVVAGMITLVFVWKFIQSQTWADDNAKLVGFSLWAFNPQFIGINAQATNDTFLILFCVAAVYYAYRFLVFQRIDSFLAMLLSSVLAGITKTNGLVAISAITVSLFVLLFVSKENTKRKFVFALAYPLIVMIGIALNPLAQYEHNYRLYGSPFLLNIEKQPAPEFFRQTYIPYAGIVSIQDGFFTFKLGDLLKNPITPIWEEIDISSHRTSFWTRLYGGANSLHFDSYPPSWLSASLMQTRIYRGIFLLALLPLALLIAGAVRDVYTSIRTVLSRDEFKARSITYGLFALLFTGYVLFTALYAFQYRTYNVIKAIFLFPGILAFTNYLLYSYQWLYSKAKDHIWQTIGITVSTVLLIGLYISDVYVLIVWLLPNQSGWEVIIDRLLHSWN